MSAFSQEPAAAEQRVYEDGPLAARDYRAEPPAADGGLDAFTTSELKFHYQYRTRATPRRVTAWTTGISVDAVVLPGKSWNRRLDDRRLMDHEQGHFDITYIAALQARLHFARQGRVTATAANGDAAVRGVETEIQRQMQPFVDAALGEHRTYDRLTQHGLDRAAQEQQRKIQRQEIVRLTDQWRREGGRAAEHDAGRANPASTDP